MKISQGRRSADRCQIGAGFDQIANPEGRFAQHIERGLQLDTCRERPMARDDARLIAGNLQPALHRRSKAVDRTARRQIDIGETPGEEGVAHMQDIRLTEMHHGVAIGVGVGNVDGLNRLAIHVKGQIIAKGEDGQYARRLGPFGLGIVETGADIMMRRDRRAELGEMGITAGMVAMPVGVDDETGRIAARAPSIRPPVLGNWSSTMTTPSGPFNTARFPATPVDSM